MTHVRYLYTTDLSLSGEEACRVGDREAPQGRQGPGTRPSGGGRGFRGYLTIFTIDNVVRELVGDLNLRSVEAFLMFLNVI
jgi:hypothetical protein